jgi:short-subunit dehydrogenase
MNIKQRYGSTAMIAGASEGIGAAFATCLATEGMDLVLIARRHEPLQKLADILANKYKVNILCITCDLSETTATRQIEETLNGREINLLIYNAALSYIGPFIKNAAENHTRAAQVNMITPLNMLCFYGEKMLAKGKGAIVLMTSLAGFQGSGYLSVYAATKAFNRILAESLWYEWKNSGVDIIACCSGATATPGYKNTLPEKTGFFTPRVLEPEEVPEECFKKLGKQPSCITGRGNRLASYIMQKILPRKMAVNIMGDTTRKMYRL